MGVLGGIYNKINFMKIFIKKLLREGLQMLQEETFNDLYQFLDQGQQKMSQGSAYYVSDMNSYMNKFILDDGGNKIPNPMYGKLFKHTRFMFKWQDTYSRAVERKNPEHEMGKRSGEFARVDGYDMLEKKGESMYLPIIPTGSEASYSVLDGGEMRKINYFEAESYLRPRSSGGSGGSGVDFRLLIIDKIVMLTGGGNKWVNPNFKGKYMGIGDIGE